MVCTDRELGGRRSAVPEIEIGITLPTMPEPRATRPRDITGLARHVEALGLGSVWVPDVTLGDGTPALEAITTLAAAAAVTERVGVGFGTLVLPIREPAWLGAQLATLQHLSNNRLLVGVGSGGFPHSPFWQALGVPARERGARTDAALEFLHPLVTGRTTRIGDTVDQPELTLAPGAPMPPVLVGGNSALAIRRAARFGDGWFPSLISPSELAARARDLDAGAAAHGRLSPQITVGGHVLIGEGESVRVAHENLVRNLVEVHGLNRKEAEKVPMYGGSPQAIAEQFAAFAEAGATRVVTSPDASEEREWMRQCELLADAQALLN